LRAIYFVLAGASRCDVPARLSRRSNAKTEIAGGIMPFNTALAPQLRRPCRESPVVRRADLFHSARSSLSAISILHRPTTNTPPRKSNALMAQNALNALMA